LKWQALPIDAPDDIREKWPALADLLSLMSYFDRQGIPEEVLKIQLNEEIRNPRQEGGSTGDDDEDMGDSGTSDQSGSARLSQPCSAEDARPRILAFPYLFQVGHAYVNHHCI
jgi:hypothetical protein